MSRAINPEDYALVISMRMLEDRTEGACRCGCGRQIIHRTATMSYRMKDGSGLCVSQGNLPDGSVVILGLTRAKSGEEADACAARIADHALDESSRFHAAAGREALVTLRHVEINSIDPVEIARKVKNGSGAVACYPHGLPGGGA
jgi:hypothetical protein